MRLFENIYLLFLDMTPVLDTNNLSINNLIMNKLILHGPNHFYQKFQAHPVHSIQSDARKLLNITRKLKSPYHLNSVSKNFFCYGPGKYQLSITWRADHPSLKNKNGSSRKIKLVLFNQRDNSRQTLLEKIQLLNQFTTHSVSIQIDDPTKQELALIIDGFDGKLQVRELRIQKLNASLFILYDPLYQENSYYPLIRANISKECATRQISFLHCHHLNTPDANISSNYLRQELDTMHQLLKQHRKKYQRIYFYCPSTLPYIMSVIMKNLQKHKINNMKYILNYMPISQTRMEMESCMRFHVDYIKNNSNIMITADNQQLFQFMQNYLGETLQQLKYLPPPYLSLQDKDSLEMLHLEDNIFRIGLVTNRKDNQKSQKILNNLLQMAEHSKNIILHLYTHTLDVLDDYQYKHENDKDYLKIFDQYQPNHLIDFIKQSDIIILDYDAEEYQLMMSKIYLLATLHQKLTILPDKSVMSYYLDTLKWGSGISYNGHKKLEGQDISFKVIKWSLDKLLGNLNKYIPKTKLSEQDLQPFLASHFMNVISGKE